MSSFFTEDSITTFLPHCHWHSFLEAYLRFFTSSIYLSLKSFLIHEIYFTAVSSEVLEFSDVCRYYLGRWAEIIAFISSLLTLLGGMIVYWILISNFLYNIVSFIYRKYEEYHLP